MLRRSLSGSKISSSTAAHVTTETMTFLMALKKVYPGTFTKIPRKTVKTDLTTLPRTPTANPMMRYHAMAQAIVAPFLFRFWMNESPSWRQIQLRMDSFIRAM